MQGFGIRQTLLGGSWVVISGVISPLSRVISIVRGLITPLIRVISIVRGLITPLITTHEPLSREHLRSLLDALDHNTCFGRSAWLL